MELLIPIIILVIAIAFILFLRYLAKYSKEPGEGTHIKYYTPQEEEMFMENDYIDEHSPENLSDQTLKNAILRNKLEKIEEKKMDRFGDFDHTRIDGK